MATTVTALRPRTKSANRYGQKDEANLNKNRYIFSPYMRIDCRNKTVGEVGFDWIETGTIHLVSNFTYPIPNSKRIIEDSRSEPEFVSYTRKAGHILDGILRNVRLDGNAPTGVVELTSLMGLDADASREDEELLYDLQVTLYPQLAVDGQAALEYLKSVESIARQKGKIYTDTLLGMRAAFQTAIRYYKAVANDLRNQMARSAKGGKEAIGMRGELFAEDEALFRWVREAVPELTSPFVNGGQVAPQPIVVPVPQVSTPQVQCLECGAFSNLIVATGLPPKKCACGAMFSQEATEEQVELASVNDDDDEASQEEFDVSTSAVAARRTLEQKQAERKAINQTRK